MSTPQEYWDACLIKTWRNDGKLLDLIQMFKSIVGKDHWELDEPLLRTPSKGMPWGVYVRPFMAAHLEKISARLWDQPPEKDVLLLKKLQTSKYTTSTQNTDRDKEMTNEGARYRRNRLKVGMSTLSSMNRNSNTNWKIVK
jgi:hypothetical protein